VDKTQTSPRLASIDRSQLILHSVDVENLIEPDHSARAIWELIGRLDLSLYYAEIAAVEGEPGRDHTAPQLLISLWLYAYSRGISSAREVARQCGYEPGFAWLLRLAADFSSDVGRLSLCPQGGGGRLIRAGCRYA
jgi:transposase